MDRILPKNLISDLEQDMLFSMRIFESLYRKRKFPVERAQYLLMLHLVDGACPSGELASRLKLDHSTVTRQIAALEANGHVTRRPNPDDGRSMLIELSELGHTTCAEMRLVRSDSMSGVLSDWGDAEVLMFSNMVKRLNDCLLQSDPPTYDEDVARIAGATSDAPRPSV